MESVFVAKKNGSAQVVFGLTDLPELNAGYGTPPVRVRAFVADVPNGFVKFTESLGKLIYAVEGNTPVEVAIGQGVINTDGLGEVVNR